MTYEQKLKNLKRIADAVRKVKAERKQQRAMYYKKLKEKHGI